MREAVLAKRFFILGAMLFFLSAVSTANAVAAAEPGSQKDTAAKAAVKQESAKSGNCTKEPCKRQFVPYRPSERIGADQAVAFPVDI